ncbi:hypothetical protein NPIL_64501 [Nephila pilipes]|uniref:Uncharacterized protein n=1 Tax=Nephila pilipes TaxID=299642 RepID=A0A8X6NAM4_NEPPI|nr:hypothetical protein NPIL_64501 [Nephila pilipes]
MHFLTTEANHRYQHHSVNTWPSIAHLLHRHSLAFSLKVNMEGGIDRFLRYLQMTTVMMTWIKGAAIHLLLRSQKVLLTFLKAPFSYELSLLEV